MTDLVMLFLAGLVIGLLSQFAISRMYRLGKRNAAMGDIDWVVIPDRADPKLVALYRESFDADKKAGNGK